MVSALLTLILYACAIGCLIFACVYLVLSSRHRLTLSNYVLFVGLAGLSVWYYYNFSSFLLNMATPPAKEPNSLFGGIVVIILNVGWLVAPFLGSIGGLHYLKRAPRKTLAALAGFAVVSVLLTLFPVTRLRLYLEPMATEVHEYQECRGWSDTHFLKAKISEEDFRRVVANLNYKPVPPSYRMVWYDDLDWWNAWRWAGEPVYIYCDPETSPTMERAMAYVNGYLYYCQYSTAD